MRQDPKWLSMKRLDYLSVGARVMLTRNEDIEDKLINGSTGTVKHIQGLRNNKPDGNIFVQFDNP